MKLEFKPIKLITTDYKMISNLVRYVGYPHTHVGLGYYRVITKKIG